MSHRLFCKLFQFKIIHLNRQENWLSKIIHKMPFYAVANGRSTGIFGTWAECEAQVKGFSGARYKKFDTMETAQNFISSYSGGSGYTNPAKPAKNNNNANNNLKRSYTTSSSNYQRSNGKSQYQNHSSSSSRYELEDEGDSSQSDEDGLETVIHKQMDDIEKRLKSFEKGVDKIMKQGAKPSGRSTILIEPPKPKKSRKSSSNGFEEDSEGYVQVYTDGACSSNGRSGAKAGIGVYWGEGHSHNVSEPVSGRATNNCGEIQAATRAIQQALQSGVTKLAINTDSKFLINSVTKWIPGWKTKGWKLKSGEPVKNEVDFKDLDRVRNKLDIKWNYVEAHKGVHGNEMADQLAKSGAARYGNKLLTN